MAAGALLALPAPAGAQEPSDADRLVELRALEGRLESAYESALRRDAIDPALGETLRDQEREHIRGLEGALEELGGAGAPSATVPLPELGSALRSREAFSRFALDLEREAAAAYARAAPALSRDTLRQPLGSIMMCEAAHAVALREAAGLALIEGQR